MRIYKLLIMLLLLTLAWSLQGQVNGVLSTMGEKTILQVWGTHYQRGYAQGYLLNTRIRDVFDEFYVLMYAYQDPVRYNYLWNWYQDHFVFHPRMHSEAEGMIAGMQAAGVQMYQPTLEREIGVEDVMLVNAFLDMRFVRGELGDMPELEFGCSSLSSWGVGTQQDSLLAGEKVITRWMDWTQISSLIANPLLVAHYPAETDEQNWISFSVPGLLGVLSAINESGVSAFLNVGNQATVNNPAALSVILYDVRDGIERLDYDSGGTSNSLDVFAALDAGNHLSGTIIHTLGGTGGEAEPIVVETDHTGTIIRHANQNGNLPSGHLAATNHFRLLAYPVCCTRYANIQDSLYADPHVTAKRQWSLLAGAAGLETNLTALQFTPSTGRILWASATPAEPAWFRPAITIEAYDLMAQNVGTSDHIQVPSPRSISVGPNPLRGGALLFVKADFPASKLEVFNTRGQIVMTREMDGKRNISIDAQRFPGGIYFLKVTDRSGTSATTKFVVLP